MQWLFADWSCHLHSTETPEFWEEEEDEEETGGSASVSMTAAVSELEEGEEEDEEEAATVPETKDHQTCLWSVMYMYSRLRQSVLDSERSIKCNVSPVTRDSFSGHWLKHWIKMSAAYNFINDVSPEEFIEFEFVWTV